MVLVALIQGVVGPFHEDFRPLNERGGKETGKGADEDFLEEGGVHPFLKATIVPAGEVFMNCRTCMFATTPLERRSAQAMRHKPFKRLTILVLETTGLKPGVTRA